LAISICLHIAVAFSISLKHHTSPPAHKATPQFTDVVLLDPNKYKTSKPPKDAKTIANQSAVGGKQSARDHITRNAKAPAPIRQASHTEMRPPSPPQQHKTQAPQANKQARILSQHNNKSLQKQLLKQAPSHHKTKHTQQRSQPRAIPLASLMPSNMALSELSRDFERERRMKQMLSKEADIPINTKEAKYAPYAHSLVHALEEQWRPGQADYQRFAERARQVLMRLTIEANGDLGGVEILRASPISVLNDSAIKAIHDAAPFKPLPSSWGLDRASFYLTFEVIDNQFVFRTM